MKSIVILLSMTLLCSSLSFGQQNPVQNLGFTQWYSTPNNYFHLQWDEPEQPHDVIIGYNIYRNNDFYMFIENETDIYNIGSATNCGGEDFLLYNNLQPFYTHVTAVYKPDSTESDYIDSVYVLGPAMTVKSYKEQRLKIYPNPSKGVVNITNNHDFKNIKVFDITGKTVKNSKFQSPIDLSNTSKGIYFIKLESDNKSITRKIILE